MEDQQKEKKVLPGVKLLYDSDKKLSYTNESILRGIAHHSYFNNVYDGNGGGDVVGGAFSIGGGSRAEVIRALGFSSSPTQEECWSKMKTININAYPGRKITIHSALENEVQQIFTNLKNCGVNLNKYIGGFVFRPINNPSHPGSKTLSMHSFGCAIDINYDLNPFVKNGKPWIGHGDDTPRGVVRTMESPIVKSFAACGWGWGGRYGDYMHFSKANGG